MKDEMTISCGWMYVIAKHGYPPCIENTFKAWEEVAKMGFRYVEFEAVGEEDLEKIIKNKKDIKNTLTELNLEVINFTPIFPELVSMDEHKRRKAIDLFKKGVELAVFLGCKTVQMDSFTPPLDFVGNSPYKDAINFGEEYRVKIRPDFNWQRQWDVLADSVKQCNMLAKGMGMKLIMEPRVGELISNTDALLRLMDSVNDENFGVIFDTGHLNAQKEILVLSIEKLGKKIFSVHVSDNDGKSNHHFSMGKGNIDWKGVFDALWKHKFSGNISLDIEGSDRIKEDYLESKSTVEKLLSERHR